MGHATRDLAIWNELTKLRPDVVTTFASYADGLKILSASKIDAIDLLLSPIGKDFERIPKLGKLLMDRRPKLVVADEELYALPLCEMLNIPVVFVTNWISSLWEYSSISFLMNAQHVIVADLEDSFQVPHWLTKPVSFAGPICRSFNFSDSDIAGLRGRLGLLAHQKLVVVTAGGGDFADVKFFRTCAYALSQLCPDAFGVVVAGSIHRSYDFFQYELGPNIRMTDHLVDLPLYLAASNLVITRGSHTTYSELINLGKPSISIPHPPDLDPENEHYARNMKRRGATEIIYEEQLTVDHLAAVVSHLLRDREQYQIMCDACVAIACRKGNEVAARIISSLV